MEGDGQTVLVVECDEKRLHKYEQWLASDYDVRAETNSEGALAAVQDGCTVVVLADDLPGVSGEEMLRRFEELGGDPRVAMVSAEQPDFDIVDMAIDDYLVEPIDGSRLREAVDHLVNLAEYSDLLDEYYRTANKVAALEAAKSQGELERSDEFARLEDRASDLQSRVTDTLQEIDDYAAAFHEVQQLPSVSPGNGVSR